MQKKLTPKAAAAYPLASSATSAQPNSQNTMTPPNPHNNNPTSNQAIKTKKTTKSQITRENLA
jgi:hypothetical protein